MTCGNDVEVRLWRGRFPHMWVHVKALMQIRKCVGWVGAGKGPGSLLDDSCRNPGVRQPWTWRGTSKRNDKGWQQRKGGP